MKTKYYFLIFIVSTINANAQLKVTDNNNVGVQVGTVTPLSSLSIGGIGSLDTKVFISGNKNTGLKIEQSGNGSGRFCAIDATTKIYFTGSPSSPTYNCAIKGKCYVPGSYTPFSRAYGVIGLAGDGESGYNYGVYGQVHTSSNGAGIVGSATYSSYNELDFYINGNYAGYFNGNVKVIGQITANNLTSSDKRLKKNISKIDKTKSLNGILSLNAYEYNIEQQYHKRLNDTAKVKLPFYDEKSQFFNKKHIGLLAQELQLIYPDLVYEDAEGYLAVDYVGIIPLLIQSIQELTTQVQILQGKGNNSSQKASAVKNGIDGNATSQDIALSTPVLDQNIPNPFSTDTQIGFYLPINTSSATLYIYDMNGVQLQNYPISERGKGTLTIQGSVLQAGMYLYTLITDGKVVDTKRMILTK